jgi:hypothetical protein
MEKSCRICIHSIGAQGGLELRCTNVASAAFIGNRWLNPGKICESYRSPELDQEMDVHCQLLAEHCMHFELEPVIAQDRAEHGLLQRHGDCSLDRRTQTEERPK